MRFRTRVLVAAMLTALELAACGKMKTDEVAGGKSEMPDEVITGFVTEESDSGRVRWRLSAPSASKFEKQKVFKMTEPRIEFYDELGNLQSTLTSESGEYFDTSRDMLAYGDVVVVTVEGDSLETDSLRYVNDQDRIVNECFNRLRRGGNVVVTGYGLECDHNLSSVNIKRDVEANIIDDKGNIIEE